ncbi:hypothetical protein [Variovorax sp. PvP013]|uniref:hypothetical protein n=1 Tax=Variovorax sp. PvP013 TaxID=3156435 RepID=UPI003D1C9363
MATQKSTQAAPDRAIEILLAEIATTAYSTEQELRASPADNAELYEHEVDRLRGVVARLGWMADIALQRLGSIHTLCNGHAEQWLLPPLAIELLSQEVES